MRLSCRTRNVTKYTLLRKLSVVGGEVTHVFGRPICIFDVGSDFLKAKLY